MLIDYIQLLEYDDYHRDYDAGAAGSFRWITHYLQLFWCNKNAQMNISNPGITAAQDVVGKHVRLSVYLCQFGFTIIYWSISPVLSHLLVLKVRFFEMLLLLVSTLGISPFLF